MFPVNNRLLFGIDILLAAIGLTLLFLYGQKLVNNKAAQEMFSKFVEKHVSISDQEKRYSVKIVR